MSQNRVVLFALVPLFCTGLALAQPPAPPTGDMPGMGHHRPDPATMAKEKCSDRLAWQVARLAYLESKLDLTDAQRPLFNKWRQLRLDDAAKEKASCTAEGAKASWRGTVVERDARLQAMLSARLQGLQASHAALQSLYDGLTPAQREILDHPRHRGGEKHRGWQGGFRGETGRDDHEDGPPNPHQH